MQYKALTYYFIFQCILQLFVYSEVLSNSGENATKQQSWFSKQFQT